MIEIAPKLWIGSQADMHEPGWAVLQTAKEPWHRQALGYAGRAAPKDHPEYLIARRGDRMILNLIDVQDSAFVPPAMVAQAVEFVRTARDKGQTVLIQCNQGQSRAPTLGLLCLAAQLPADFAAAEAEFLNLYPAYAPSQGMRGFAETHWASYRGSASELDAGALDTANQLWSTFCSDLRDDPARARDRLISGIVRALVGAASGEAPKPRLEIE
jgi:hypothetical protein